QRLHLRDEQTAGIDRLDLQLCESAGGGVARVAVLPGAVRGTRADRDGDHFHGCLYCEAVRAKELKRGRPARPRALDRRGTALLRACRRAREASRRTGTFPPRRWRSCPGSEELRPTDVP